MSKPTKIYKGIVLILLATFCIVLMNTCAKMSSSALDIIEIVFYRGLIALSLLIPYMMLTQPLLVFKTKRFKTHLYRAFVGNLGVGLVFWSYALLPMADATALLFAAPLFVTILSPIMLKEKVDRYRWAAVIAGFGGILSIAKPSGDMFSNPASLIALAAALCVALVNIALRNLGRTDEALTTVFYFNWCIDFGSLHLILRFSPGLGYPALDLRHRHICRHPTGGQNNGLPVCRSLPPCSLYVYFHRMGNLDGMDFLA